MSVEVWAEVNEDGNVTRYHSPNGQAITAKYDGKGEYSVSLGGNFKTVPYVLATVRADNSDPTSKVVSVIEVEEEFAKVGIKASDTSKRPFTLHAYQP